MNVREREREMPPRPLIPWLAAFFAGLAGASALVLNAAADVLLGEGSWDIRTFWFLSVFAVTLAALGKACPWVARWKRGIYAASVGVVAGALVSALWSASALHASRALDGRAASSLEFVVQGDPSINEEIYSYTCDAYAKGKRLGAVRLSCGRSLDAGCRVRVIGRILPFSNDSYGRSRVLRGEVRKVKAVRIVSIQGGSPSLLLRFRSALLDAVDPVADPAVRSSPVSSAAVLPSCARSRRAIGFR